MSEASALRVPLDECGLARAVAVIGDRWTLLVLREAHYGVTRFDEMRADIDIPKAALSMRLKALVDEGLLEKRPYREPGSRTRDEYLLTTKGRELLPALIALMQWGDRHLTPEAGPLQFRHAGCGGLVTAQLVCECGSPAATAELEPRLR
ncbi:transcriptional regulator [Prescottella agglutinans]|uniref:Transcriptional regulator n=1 Tax=Prescottella agglutinans TaxID=1644129 RepID=A0A438BKQ3_9NOCA|nr:helix-turn-helix domain-containing protein [Prescottella agglutinans]RVW11567.1 transcriptional regulator [Prescottella agglutinans]